MKKIYVFLTSAIVMGILLTGCAGEPLELKISSDMIKVANDAGIVITAEQETTNTDGSITYIIKKSDHSKLLDAVSDNIDVAIAKVFEIETHGELFKDIAFSEDYTTLTVKMQDASTNLLYVLFFLPEVVLKGEMYQQFNGVQDSSIKLIVIDDATGEVVAEEVLP